MELKGKTKVAIVGEVNAGKSSLIKRLTKHLKINISPLPGETVISKVYDYKDIALIDTPGLNDVNTKTTKKIKKELKDFDNVIVFLNAAGTVLSNNELDLYKTLKKNKANILIVINKIDKADSIDSIIRYVKQKIEDSSPIIAISTKTGENIEELEKALVEMK